jgi:SAM-dependent methyltransferase
MAERDYVLGTHDDEIYRLGLQHRVWRARVLEAWTRARIGEGASVIDFGAGPGFATMDLAEIVGPKGKVFALERSRRFLDVLEAQAKARGLKHVETHEVDVATDPLPVSGTDAAWVRWVFAFLPNAREALEKLVAAIKPGGALVIFEYIDYRTLGLRPTSEGFDRFVDEVVANWRASGGEPDIGRVLPPWLCELGMAIESTRPHIDLLTPRDAMWRWPESFFHLHIERLLELKRITPDDAGAMRDEFERAAQAPGALMVTPLVVEIVARKPA